MKKTSVVGLAVLLMLSSVSFSENIWWAGGDPERGGDDNLWVNPVNWDPDGVPSDLDNVWIEGYLNQADPNDPNNVFTIVPCVLNDSRRCGWLWLGQYGVETPGQLDITSTGTLTNVGRTYMGNDINNSAGGAIEGIINIALGGMLTTQEMFIGYQNGTGTVTVAGLLNASELNVAFGEWGDNEVTYGYLTVEGTGGVYTSNNPGLFIERFDSATSGILDGLVDVKAGGHIFLNGDQTTIMQAYADGGDIISSNGTLEITYNAGDDKTTITAKGIPQDCATAISMGYGLAGDVNGDCYVNLLDLAVMAGDWLKCVDPTDASCAEPWL